MRRVIFVFLIALPVVFLALYYAVTNGLLPRGWETVQRRLDTGDLRYCILGVPYDYERQTTDLRDVLAKLAAMDPPLPHVWYTEWTGARCEGRIYMGAAPHGNEVPGPLPGPPPKLIRCSDVSCWTSRRPRTFHPGQFRSSSHGSGRAWSCSIRTGTTGEAHTCTPDWFGGPEALAILAVLAYKPIRMEDSAPDAAAYLWPNQKDPTALDAMGRTVLHRAAFWDATTWSGRCSPRASTATRGMRTTGRRSTRPRFGARCRLCRPCSTPALTWICRARRPEKLEAYAQALADAGTSWDDLYLDGGGSGATTRATLAPLSNGTRWGATPLHLAVYGGRLDVIGFLLDHGAHIDTLDANGHTPLMWAAAAGRADAVKANLSPAAQTPGWWTRRACRRRPGRRSASGRPWRVCSSSNWQLSGGGWPCNVLLRSRTWPSWLPWAPWSPICGRKARGLAVGAGFWRGCSSSPGWSWPYGWNAGSTSRWTE